MKCPVCKTHGEYAGINLHADGFAENINTCHVCETTWSVNHGISKVIEDSTFLETTADCDEEDTYCFAA
jgi:hypothetical protein